jgi:hypothetical protein
MFATLHLHADANTALTISPRPAGILVVRRGVAPVRGVACNNMDWHEHFTYNAETGDLIWRHRPQHLCKSEVYWRRWNSRCEGKVAGAKALSSNNGRPKEVVVSFTMFGYRRLIAHRVIWKMFNGEIPPKMDIDHINGNPWDNRLQNLRLATRSQNSHNSRKSSRNTSGYKGVSWFPPTKRWTAQIAFEGVNYKLGYFIKKEDAIEARRRAAEKLHGKFARHE